MTTPVNSGGSLLRTRLRCRQVHHLTGLKGFDGVAGVVVLGPAGDYRNSAKLTKAKTNVEEIPTIPAYMIPHVTGQLGLYA